MEIDDNMECEDYNISKSNSCFQSHAVPEVGIPEYRSNHKSAVPADTEEIKFKFGMMCISNEDNYSQTHYHQDHEMVPETDNQSFNKQILAIVKFILVAASSNDIDKQKEKLYQLYQKQYSEYISKLNGLSKDVKIEKCNNFNEI